MTVENISIDVKTNAGSAAKEFRSLSDAMRGVSGAASKTNGATSSVRGVGNAAKAATKHTSNLFNSIKRIAMYRLLRTALKAIGSAFKEGLENAYKFSQGIDGTLAASLDSISTKSLTMKNQLGAAFGNLLTMLTPILLRIISLVTQAAQAIAALFSALGGGQYLVAKDTASAWKTATGAAKEYKNTILGFDEINRLDDEKGGGGGGGINPEDMFELGELPPWAQKIVEWKDKITELLGGSLSGLETLLYDATLVVGAILAFSGANIPLGIGLMAIGAYGRWKTISENWDAMTPQVKGVITAIESVVGKALLALGVILAFSGANIPLGLGLIAVGAAMLATSKAEGWDYVPNNVKSVLAIIEFAASAAMLALGIILALSGANVPLGIGLVAVGAVGLATEKPGLWNSVPTKTKSTLAIISEIAAGALIAVGIILTLTGNIPLGLGMLVAGLATHFASRQALWDYLPRQTQAKLAEIGAIAGIALLGLGIILLITGNIALGLGIILASSALLAQAASFDIDGTTGEINGALNSIGSNGETQIGRIVTALQSVVSWCQNVVNWLGSVFSNAGSVQTRLNDIQSYKSTYGDVWGEVVRGSELGLYASGGFPETGELYISREAGPELVGTIGGRTAVANNDQIVEAVASGVYEAVSSAMSNNDDRPLQVRVYLDSREIRTGQNRYAMAMGV